MANYSITNSTNVVAQTANAATYVGLIAVAASTNAFVNPVTYTSLRRGKIYDILIGTNGTPADNFMEYIVNRITVSTTLTWVGSISSVSSTFALDQADPGFSAFALVNSSVASSAAFTVSTPVWYVGVNQRASYRWVAAPGSEMVYPATSSNGLALGSRSGAYTGTATGTVLFQEQ